MAVSQRLPCSISYSFRAVSPIKVAWSVRPLTLNWRKDGLIFMKCDTEIYRTGHEKVARLPFCTCPCDILSGVSMYIA